MAAFLLLVAWPGHGGAAADVLERYNPKDDPNYAPGPSKSLAVQGEAIWKLVEAFQGEPIPRAERREVVAQSAPPQPDHYTRETAPSVSRGTVQDPFFINPFGYPYAPYGSSYLWWHERSPRIPWWSLIPFAKGDKDFFDHFGHFRFGRPHGGQFHFGFRHHP
jgi:hypothetical protein